MRAPQLVPAPGLPERVTVYEVSPRDGLQNEAEIVPTEVKAELIEATSLVRPDRVPQLADAERLMAALPRREGVRYPVLVPNLRGLERALDLGLAEIAVFASATESFAKANLGRGVDEALAMFAPVIESGVPAHGRHYGLVPHESRRTRAAVERTRSLDVGPIGRDRP